ncbi:MAG TPA: DUF308 domain-containing protein [Puia sp.]|jgi:hypothetical protein|nr:DUF308 domain-containing protein [Puia sp.]
METQTAPLDALQDIRKMMEKSSRFISLSGWSGVSAGIFGLIGAWYANILLEKSDAVGRTSGAGGIRFQLMVLAAVVFFCAVTSAFLLTWMRTRRDGMAIWGPSARRLMWNTMLPMLVGGLVILKMISDEYYTLIAPSALLFYGLALVNGSKYTLGEIRYVGYLEILLGIICLAWPSHGLIFWTLGFGIVHIVYGIMMWRKYERKSV